MKLSKTILPLLICFSLILTSVGTAFAAETTQELQKDASGTYLIGTADELFAFNELARATAEADNANGSTRTVLSAKLTADINLNPGAAFAYDHETGLVTVSNGGKSCIMGTGMKGTELGNFHPVYNGLCTLAQWNNEDLTEEQLKKFRNDLTEKMNEKVEALGLNKWTPIGTSTMPYIGYFDGNGYTIDGLYINDNTVGYTGLFGVTGNYSTISGTYDYGRVENINIGEHSLIVGYRADTGGATGAIVGMTKFDKIINCTNYATVVGKGSDRLALSNSGLVGGIVGYANNDVRNCVNRGTVVSCESAGGIAGNIMGNQNQQGNIIHCANYGKVYAEAHSFTGYAGGIAINSGVGNGTAPGCGGNVESCVNYGYVEGYYVGGVIYRGSQNTRVKYCANRGTATGTSFVSGIITFIANGGFTMEGCYNAGTVAALPYKGSGTIIPKVFPLAASVDTSGYHTVKNCYNDETVCPSNGALFREGVTASGSYGVPTEFFATGEPAYKMGSLNSKGWRQNIPTPAEEGKTPETYPTADGTRLVYEVTHYCCHTDNTNRQDHKEVFYSNNYGDITDGHNPDESGICKHCGADTRKPVFLADTLPEAKAGKSYSVTIRLSDSVPSTLGYIDATVSETDDTKYVFTRGLTGEAKYSYDSKYYYYISGIPTEAGELTFTLSATNANGTAKKTYTLKINESDPLKIDTNSKLDNGTVGESYSCKLECYSTDFEKTWSVAEGSTLPAGLTLTKDGIISGKPTAEGDCSFTIVLAAGEQTATKTFTLKVFGEGGCKHENKTLIKGTPATCIHDGTADYYHCNTCEKDIDKYGNEIGNTNDLKSASNHSDKNNDGKCDFCGKNMPIFKKVTKGSEIVYGGTYILAAKIGGKYYALPLPPEGKDGREYPELMSLCEISPNADGSFNFNGLEANNAIMLKTEFAAESSGLDAGRPRYTLFSVFDGKRYSLVGDDYSAKFYLENYEYAKYGYRIELNSSGEVLIGSVYQQWWNPSETADNGLLRAFDMTYNGKNTKFMSFFGESEYTGDGAAYSGAKMTEYPIYLYRMTDIGTAGRITFISNGSTDNVSSTDEVMEIFELNSDTAADASLSNVSGITDAVNHTAVTSCIEAAATTQTSVTAEIYADITATAAETDENDSKTLTSVTYSVTPKIDIKDSEGNILSTSPISDSDLNGAPITVTLYAGFRPEQIIHYKKDGTNEYFYNQESEKAENGANTFEYINGFVTFTITDFSDFKLLRTAEAEKSSENGLSFDGKTITAAVDKDGSYTFVFAVNEKDGRLSYMTTSVQSLKAGENTVKIPKNVDIFTVNKVLLLKDLTSLQPICKALEMNVK